MSAALGALVLAALMVGGAAGPAAADKDKDCATVVVGPGNSGMTETERQIAQCDSSSDTGEQKVVKNRGGGTPPGQQP